MVSSDFDLSDRSLSVEERLSKLFALNQGLVLALQNVLRRVGAYNDLLGEELEGKPAAADYLQKSRDVVSRAEAWLTSLRAVVRAPVESETFAVRTMLEGIVKRCRKVLGEKTPIALHMPEDELVVNGSLFQLQEIFMGATTWFTDRNAGRTVTVRTAVHTLDDRFVGTMKSVCVPGPHLVVTLTADADVFVPDRQLLFWDVCLSESGLDDQQALSLFQIYGMVIAHRGDIFYQTSSSGAPALSLALPMPETRKGMQAPHNLADDSLRGQETILLVDDEDMIWDVIIDMLQELGYTVILAGNGLEAVEVYRANPGGIDLVLLDMVMPKLDGHEAFFQLRAIDPKVKVLLSSGYVSEEDARDVLDAGALGFLQKPYRMSDLARKIRSIFDTRSVR